MSNDGDQGPIDAVLDALGDQRRRYALYFLRDRDAVAVETLATALTGWLAVRDGATTAWPQDRDRVLASLHHQDLPKLDAAGLVAYDREAGTVTFEESALARDLLDLLLAYERRAEPLEAGADAADPEV